MRVGVLGAGQLALMLAQAGAKLGATFMFLSPDDDACAARAGHHLNAAFDSEDALAHLATWADVVTYEFENVPVSAVEWLEHRVATHPSSGALRVAQDRLYEKRAFTQIGIPVPGYRAVCDISELAQAIGSLGVPAILKTRTQGYDGKGQVVLRDSHRATLAAAWDAIAGAPAILEELIPFDRELSVIATRTGGGRCVCYPLTENRHRDGILRVSTALLDDPIRDQAEAYAHRLLDHLGYVGTIALELFESEGRLLANEMAPRVHNSGHWTIEGAVTSQFENHLRAVSGLALGSAAIVDGAAMVNLIGEIPDEALIRAIPGTFLHLYGKTPRPGRKVGHVTLLRNGEEEPTFRERISRVLELAGEDLIAAETRSAGPTQATLPLSSSFDW